MIQADWLHDQIVRSVERQGIVINRRLGFNVQIIPGKTGAALVRFKLLDAFLRPHNHSSAQQSQLSIQAYSPEMMEQLRLDGVPEPPTFLSVGYQLFDDETGINRIVVACHYDDRLLLLLRPG